MAYKVEQFKKTADGAGQNGSAPDHREMSRVNRLMSICNCFRHRLLLARGGKNAWMRVNAFFVP
jgi:hypothetical protein